MDSRKRKKRLEGFIVFAGPTNEGLDILRRSGVSVKLNNSSIATGFSRLNFVTPLETSSSVSLKDQTANMMPDDNHCQ